MNRLYGWRLNPLYHSGALVVVSLVVMLVTGLYLLLFYRIGAPYESVGRITDQVWAGRWIRALHRYASDLAVLAAIVHAFRMFAQRRTWGPRTLAWISGLFLLFVIYVCGWTGYVMIWDQQAQLLAAEGARLMDALPLFSEPLGRAFVGDGTIPAAFFFLNLFLHIALPIGVALVLWLHVSRISGPALLPPRRLLWGSVILLTALSLFWPVGMDAPADPFRLPGRVPLDWFYSFWLPFSQRLSPAAVWAALGVGATALLLVPALTRPRAEQRPAPSVVEQRYCTGCNQCAVDCPYEAITMVERTDGREYLVAQVDPALCVSCGICAGSCAPMGVGPPLRTGRDQLEEVRSFIADRAPGPDDVVILACENGAGRVAAGPELNGAPVYAVDCVGNLHTSVIELLVRSGVGGVVIASCPPRDCWNRLGPFWMEQRVYYEREAELQERVDRDRVRVVYAGEAERPVVEAGLDAFRRDIARLSAAESERDIEIDTECEVTPLEEAVDA
jgi:ferredoxin